MRFPNQPTFPRVRLIIMQFTQRLVAATGLFVFSFISLTNQYKDKKIGISSKELSDICLNFERKLRACNIVRFSNSNMPLSSDVPF